MADKPNCWEYQNCGREPGGKNAVKFGVCPAAVDRRWDGAHSGKNGGRVCWEIKETGCREVLSEISGQTMAMRYGDCTVCGFYDHVRFRESPNFFPGASLLDLNFD